MIRFEFKRGISLKRARTRQINWELTTGKFINQDLNRIPRDGVVRNSGQVRNTTQDSCGTLITVSKMSTSSVHGGGDDNYHDCEPHISIIRSAGVPHFSRARLSRGVKKVRSVDECPSMRYDARRKEKMKNVKCKKKIY